MCGGARASAGSQPTMVPSYIAGFVAPPRSTRIRTCVPAVTAKGNTEGTAHGKHWADRQRGESFHQPLPLFTATPRRLSKAKPTAPPTNRCQGNMQLTRLPMRPFPFVRHCASSPQMPAAAAGCCDGGGVG